jgi:CRISPR/Cas system-associated protein endoribonuclease Cas2
MTDADYEALLKRYNSCQKGLETLSEKIRNLETINAILTAEKNQWNEQKILQDQVIQHQLGNSDEVVKQLQDEIRKIKKKYNIRD